MVVSDKMIADCTVKRLERLILCPVTHQWVSEDDCRECMKLHDYRPPCMDFIEGDC